MHEKCLPLHSVISFSVINYVVSMRRPRASGEVSFFLHHSSSGKRKTELQSAFLPIFHPYLATMEINGVTHN